MNTHIQELIYTANKLCFSLDEIIKKDKEFSLNVLIELDKINLNTQKIRINLTEIRDYIS